MADSQPLESAPAATPEAPEHSAQASKPMEITVALVCLVFMGTALWLSVNLDLRREAAPGQIDARFWPILLSVVGLTLSAWRLIVALVAAPDDRDDTEAIQPGGVRRLILTLLLTLGFVGVWSMHSVIIGGYRITLFVPAAMIYLAALVALYGFRGWRRSWRSMVIYPVLMSIGIYLLFGQLLRIPL